MTRDEFHKRAYELGQQAAFEKQAVLPILGPVAKFIAQAYRWGRGAFTNAMGSVGRGVLNVAGAPKVGVKGTSIGRWLNIAGKNVPKQMWQLGTLGGGFGALTNPEDRLGGAARGVVGGALSGATFGAAHNVIKNVMPVIGRKFAPGIYNPLRRAAQPKIIRGLTKQEQLSRAATEKLDIDPKAMLTPQDAAARTAIPKVPAWYSRLRFVGKDAPMSYGQAAKSFGAKAVLGAVPIAGAMATDRYLAPSVGGQQY